MRIACSLSLWKAFDIFENNIYHGFETESFLIYAMHMDISIIISRILYIVFRGQLPLTNYILTIITTITLICAFGRLLRKTSPSTARFLCGR